MDRVGRASAMVVDGRGHHGVTPLVFTNDYNQTQLGATNCTIQTKENKAARQYTITTTFKHLFDQNYSMILAFVGKYRLGSHNKSFCEVSCWVEIDYIRMLVCQERQVHVVLA